MIREPAGVRAAVLTGLGAAVLATGGQPAPACAQEAGRRARGGGRPRPGRAQGPVRPSRRAAYRRGGGGAARGALRSRRGRRGASRGRPESGGPRRGPRSARRQDLRGAAGRPPVRRRGAGDYQGRGAVSAGWRPCLLAGGEGGSQSGFANRRAHDEGDERLGDRMAAATEPPTTPAAPRAGDGRLGDRMGAAGSRSGRGGRASRRRCRRRRPSWPSSRPSARRRSR